MHCIFSVTVQPATIPRGVFAQNARKPEACSAKLHEMQFLCIAKRVIVQHG